MKTDRITCEYCAVLNPPDGKRCMACGAPLPVRRVIPPRVTVVEPPRSPATPPAALESQPIGDQIKEGMAVVGTSLGALGIGTILLRMAAQFAAIAGASFIIGINTGQATIVTRTVPLMVLLALTGGALTGLCVGLAVKRAFWILVSAPAGALFGTILAIFLSLNKSHDIPWLALFSAAGAILFALLGGRQSARNSLRCVQIVRPIFGSIIGLLFSLLGFLVTYRIY